MSATAHKASQPPIVPRLAGLLDKLEPSGSAVMLISSLIVGIGTGLVAILFVKSIDGVHWLFYEWLPTLAGTPLFWIILLAPAVGALISGLLIHHFAREAKGHGVSEVIEAIALRGGVIRPIVPLIKGITSAVTVGSGGSAGPEGPIVQIGAALGSVLGSEMRLSNERIRNLVACGAAGGIAATFNAPIAGVMFAVEIILGELNIGNLSTVIIAAVTASTVARTALGGAHIFPVPQTYEFRSPWEFLFYIVLGILAGLLAVFQVRSMHWVEDLFAGLRSVPDWFKPVIGALLLGLLAVVYPLMIPGMAYEGVPSIYGDGHAEIEGALANMSGAFVVIGLLVLKLIATNLTLGSGGSGGVFAPTLFIGAMLGAALGWGVDWLFPAISAPPGAYALVGMAALFSGTAHAPITSILMLFELTGDYRIILPLMLASVISTLIARPLLGGESIYTLKLAERGVRLRSGRDLDVLQGVTVGEVMATEIETARPDWTIMQLSWALDHSRQNGFPVQDEAGRLRGMATVSDLDRALTREMPSHTLVEAIATPRSRLLVAYPDETMGVALARMSRLGLGRIPVVERADPDRLLGVIRREDIIRAYNVALTRRAEIQQRGKTLHLRDVDGTRFVDLTLEEGHLAVGRSIMEVARDMPSECVLVSIRRAGEVLIPHGQTVLAAGDLVTAFVREDQRPALLTCLTGHKPSLLDGVL